MLKIQDDWGEQDTAAIMRGNKLRQEGTGPIRMMFFLGPVFPPEKKNGLSCFSHNRGPPPQFQEPELFWKKN